VIEISFDESNMGARTTLSVKFDIPRMLNDQEILYLDLTQILSSINSDTQMFSLKLYRFWNLEELPLTYRYDRQIALQNRLKLLISLEDRTQFTVDEYLFVLDGVYLPYEFNDRSNFNDEYLLIQFVRSLDYSISISNTDETSSKFPALNETVADSNIGLDITSDAHFLNEVFLSRYTFSIQSTVIFTNQSRIFISFPKYYSTKISDFAKNIQCKLSE
jgi:hypothetical protein